MTGPVEGGTNSSNPFSLLVMISEVKSSRDSSIQSVWTLIHHKSEIRSYTSLSPCGNYRAVATSAPAAIFILVDPRLAGVDGNRHKFQRIVDAVFLSL